MVGVLKTKPRCFSVSYQNLQTWSVAAQYAVEWRWPDEVIKPLGSILKRRSEAALNTLLPESFVNLLTIRFDGSIEPREPVQIQNVKGKLFRVYPGDVIFSKIDVRNGAIGLAPNDIDSMCATSEFPIYSVETKKAHPEYIKLLFRSAVFKKLLNSMISGASGRKRIQPSQLEGVQVPIPPPSIQQKIVEYWEKGNIKANKHAELSHDISNSIPDYLVSEIGLKSLKQAHSRRSFVSSWKEIDRWGVNLAREMTCRPNLSKSPFPVVSLSEVISDLQNGWSPKCLGRKVEENEWGVLKVGAVSFGWFDENQNKALPSNLKPREHYEVKSGDLIISRANITQYVGACALVGEVRPQLMLCDKLFRVIWKQDSTILPEYLNEILKTPHLRWQIENNLTGASPTMKNISKPALMALQFPLPPLNVQEKIIKSIESKRVESRTLLQKSSDNLKALTKKVEKYILGTLSVEDL